MKKISAIYKAIIILFICISSYAEDEAELALGMEAGSEDILNENNIYLSPLIKYKRDEMQIKLQWEPYIFPDKNYGKLAISGKKEFNYDDIFILELENENEFSLTGEEHEDFLIIEAEYNIYNFRLGMEIETAYLPERVLYMGNLIEYELESDKYEEIELELKYIYQVAPEKRAEEIGFKLKYGIKIFKNYCIETELVPKYSIPDKEYAFESMIAFCYII